MNRNQAYKFLDLSPNSAPYEVEQAYRQKMQELQTKLSTGQSLTTREQAQQQITTLASAWEVLQKECTQNAKSARPRIHLEEIFSVKPILTWIFGVEPAPRIAVIASILLSLIVMMLIALACYGCF